MRCVIPRDDRGGRRGKLSKMARWPPGASARSKLHDRSRGPRQGLRRAARRRRPVVPGRRGGDRRAGRPQRRRQDQHATLPVRHPAAGVGNAAGGRSRRPDRCDPRQARARLRPRHAAPVRPPHRGRAPPVHRARLPPRRRLVARRVAPRRARAAREAGRARFDPVAWHAAEARHRRRVRARSGRDPPRRAADGTRPARHPYHAGRDPQARGRRRRRPRVVPTCSSSSSGCATGC